MSVATAPDSPVQRPWHIAKRCGRSREHPPRAALELFDRERGAAGQNERSGVKGLPPPDHSGRELRGDRQGGHGGHDGEASQSCQRRSELSGYLRRGFFRRSLSVQRAQPHVWRAIPVLRARGSGHSPSGRGHHHGGRAAAQGLLGRRSSAHGWGEVLARYPDNTPAVVQGSFGKGWVVLTGVHAEAPESWRRDLAFTTPVAPSHAYARLIDAALHRTLLPRH
jgi:hypothetical protein